MQRGLITDNDRATSRMVRQAERAGMMPWRPPSWSSAAMFARMRLKERAAERRGRRWCHSTTAWPRVRARIDRRRGSQRIADPHACLLCPLAGEDRNPPCPIHQGPPCRCCATWSEFLAKEDASRADACLDARACAADEDGSGYRCGDCGWCLGEAADRRTAEALARPLEASYHAGPFANPSWMLRHPFRLWYEWNRPLRVWYYRTDQSYDARTTDETYTRTAMARGWPWGCA